MSSSAVAAPPGRRADTSRRRRLFTGLALGTFVAALDQTVVATALPRITGELGGLSSYTWLATAYLLTATAFTPLYGRLSDHVGRRAPYLVALGVFVAGSVAATAARTMGELIGARAVQGLGAAGLLTLAVAVIGDELAPRERARYQGLFGGIFALASVVGPPLGGVLTDTAGWRWVFALNIPLGVVTALVVAPVLPRVRAVHARVDYLGAALLVGGISSLLLGAVWGGVERPWGSATILGLLAAGAVLLLAFVVRERRFATPILPVRLFQDRSFAIACTAGFFVGACLFGAIYFVPLFLQVAQHRSASAAGRSLLILTLALVVGAGLSGRLISRTGRLRPFPIAGTAVLTVGFALLRGADATTGGLAIGLDLALIGLGVGLVMQVLVLAVQNTAPRESLGAATSAAGFYRSIGGTVGTAALGALLANRMGSFGAATTAGGAPGAVRLLDGTGLEAFVAGMRAVFLVATVLAAIAFALCLALPRVPLRDGRMDEELDPQITNS
ncbi:MAG: hypothetical protein QOK14_1888 [Frankiaceae bacterium]|nr:hypothetical protein [Frankiaceae bacterium]